MPSILSGLNSVQQALSAQQYGLSIAQKNVSNINNAAYARQDVIFGANADGGATPGIPGLSLRSVRDGFIDYGISRETQLLSKSSVEHGALKQIDALFASQGSAGLEEALSGFFNSFSELSGNPESLPLRQQVLSSANTLAREFQRLYGGAQRIQSFENQAVKSTLEDVNSITVRIAELNGRIQGAQGSRSDEEYSLRDERQQLMEQLSELTGVTYYETESGAYTVTTGDGAVLVVGDEHRELQLGPMGSGGFPTIMLDGADVTDTIDAGALGGHLAMRDGAIAEYLETLDDMAAGLIARVNEVHAQGIDLNGDPGGDLFAPFVPAIPGSNVGAARSISVSLSDPREVTAAASGTAAGNNENAKHLAAIGEETLFSAGTATAGDVYASLIYRIGSAEKSAEDASNTQKHLIDQLKNQRSAVSGVDLNEEAINIIKYQKAYQASARFADVLDGLSNEILQLLGA